MKYAATLLFLVVGLAFVVLAMRPNEHEAASRSSPAAPRATAKESHVSAASALAEPAGVSVTRSASGADVVAVRTLRGRVVDADGRAVEAATLLVISADAADLEKTPALERGGSGADGRFEIGMAADAGAVALAVSAPGHRDALVRVDDDADVVVVLEPRRSSVTVVGRVVDSGRTLPQFDVREYVRPASGAEGLEERWTTVAQTEAGFTHVLATWGAKEPQLTVRARGFLATTRTLPATGDERVDVGVIELARSANHRGFVVDPTGAPVGGAVVLPLLEHGAKGAAVRSAVEDGGFEISAREGLEPEALFVSAPSFAARLVRRSDAGGTWDAIVVQLEPGTRIEGRVTQADGTAAGGVTLRAWLADTTGTELSGGIMNSAVWVRDARTDETGRYAFEDAPNGTVSVGVTAENPDELMSVRRLRALHVSGERLVTCDFTIGDGHAVRGRLQFPFPLPHESLIVELHALRGGERRTVASAQTPPSAPFVFEDANWDPATEELVLRISVAPGFHVDRPVVARGADGDLGVIRFADAKSLLEFNRGEQRVFQLAEQR